jgi:hypothetical protein
MRTIGIAVVPPWREARHLEDLPRFCTEAGITDLGLMIQCHPESVPLMQKIDEGLSRFVEARDRVRAVGVKAGILLQTTVNHGERYHPLSTVDFQRIVGEDGAVCEACFCPADDGFLDYMDAVAESFAGADPDFLLVDDDFRLSHHQPARFGCFCEKHLRLFSEEFGESLDRDELVSLMSGDTDRSKNARHSWLEVRRQTYMDFCRRFRKSIDKVDPGINCGFCNVKWNTDVTEEAARILAGNNRPFARLNAGIYLNSSPNRFASAMVQTAGIRATIPSDIECLSEADTCPHTRYSLSAAALNAYITGTLLSGTDGAKLWIANCQEWYLEESDKYREVVGGAATFHEQVRIATSQTEWLGPCAPQSFQRNTELTWRPDAGMWNRLSESPNWAGTLFARYGLPWQVTDTNAPVAIAGDTAVAYGEAELNELFRGAVLVDGRAAEILASRGYAELMGVRTDTSESLRISFERFSDDSDIHGRYAGTSVNISIPDIPRLIPVADDVRIVSNFVAVPFFQSTVETVVSPAVTLYENSLGGRVAVYATLPGFGGLGSLNDRVKQQLVGVLSWIGRRSLPVWTVNTADVFLRFGRIEKDYLLAIINLNPDTISPIELEIPDLQPKTMHRLSENGTWEEISFSQRGSRLTIETNLSIFETLIARISV